MSRAKAEEALGRVQYDKHTVAPNLHGIIIGQVMPVYVSPEVDKAYSYGELNSIQGYICPANKIQDTAYIQKMIGYYGDVVVVDSAMRRVI